MTKAWEDCPTHTEGAKHWIDSMGTVCDGPCPTCEAHFKALDEATKVYRDREVLLARIVALQDAVLDACAGMMGCGGMKDATYWAWHDVHKNALDDLFRARQALALSLAEKQAEPANGEQ